MAETALEKVLPNPTEKILSGMNKTQKLAALMVILGPEEASSILSSFNQRMVEQIMAEMAKIEFISAEVQQALIEEFSVLTLDAVTSALGGLDKAQFVLEKTLGPIKAREVMGRVAPGIAPSPQIEELRNVPVPSIIEILQGEHNQTWALVLAQLDAHTSAEVFRKLDPGFRADVMRRMARLDPVEPDVLDGVIQGLLARRPEASLRNNIKTEGPKYLTEVMKNLDRQLANEVLELLGQEDPELSSSVRKMMFVFDDLAKLDTAAISTILREVDFNSLAIAMKDCCPEVSELIFKNITKRAAESLHENLKYSSNVRRKEVDEARGRVMEVVFELERKGDISLYKDEEAHAPA